MNRNREIPISQLPEHEQREFQNYVPNELTDEEREIRERQQQELERRLDIILAKTDEPMNSMIRLAIRGNKPRDLIRERFPFTCETNDRRTLIVRISQTKKRVLRQC